MDGVGNCPPHSATELNHWKGNQLGPGTDGGAAGSPVHQFPVLFQKIPRVCFNRATNAGNVKKRGETFA